jgi:predicted tellurium resistance membrane protein TerC
VFEWISDPQQWIALVTLTVLEVVLGIDNVIFISILAGKLPVHQRDRARRLGLAAAMITRVLLLLSLTWMMKLTRPLFSVPIMGQEVSGRDLILILGGLFLMAKSVHEIHDRLEGEEGHGSARAAATFGGVIVQIMLLDVVFSLDSVITAVGMAQSIAVMVTAVVIAVGFMMWFSGPVSTFVEQHPTVKMLALAFLLLIGVNLVADGFGQHIPRGYLYFAMGFSVFVEMLNLRAKAKAAPVHLRSAYTADDGQGS